MEALMVCARAAVSPRGGTLYATTFPCHNCAKHIVVAGVSRVVFVEPYPKSKALDLHSDAIALEEDTVGKVCFVPFVGVTARRYFDLFSMRLSTGKTMPRKDKATGKIAPWHRTPESTSRFHLVANSYIDRELLAAAEISSLLQTGKQGER